MKKLVVMGLILTALSLAACAYHAKQPVNDEYYKQTRQVAWPETEK